MTFTNFQKLNCAVRELAYRQRVYSRLVERGKMSKADMTREIELMRDIADDYRALAAADEPEFW